MRRASLLVLLVALVGAPTAGQSLRTRIDRLLDGPPFNRTSWGVVLTDSGGRVLYARNADRLFIPASNTKLVVTAAASVLLDPETRIETTIYANGPVEDGTLRGDLIVYGRGDPTFSERCYDTDTLALGACDRVWDRILALADSVRARGIRHVAGAVVGDGSYFDDVLVHPGWKTYDVNWWYGSPVGALGLNDNALDITWAPGPDGGAPAQLTVFPDLGVIRLENRTRTTDSGTASTIDFFRRPGTLDLWAEGTVALDRGARTVYFALPDPNLYFAAALRAALLGRGVSVAGPARATTDSALYLAARMGPPLVRFWSRPITDVVFPILNTSQNWFAEMLLKQLGRRFGDTGSWDGGLAVEQAFLVDSVGLDGTAFSLSDGSGLSTGNLVSPNAFAALLRYMWTHPRRAAFLRALPRSGKPGSLRTRFVGTPLEGRVVAKTGSIQHVNSLSGFIERPRGGPLVFSIMANNHTVPGGQMLRQIDSIVVTMGR